MGFMREKHGKHYAANSRETIRRQTMAFILEGVHTCTFEVLKKIGARLLVWQGVVRKPRCQEMAGAARLVATALFQPTQSALPTVDHIRHVKSCPQLSMRRGALPWERNTIRRHGELPCGGFRQIRTPADCLVSVQARCRTKR
jgi:hypothetical protein